MSANTIASIRNKLSVLRPNTSVVVQYEDRDVLVEFTEQRKFVVGARKLKTNSLQIATRYVTLPNINEAVVPLTTTTLAESFAKFPSADPDANVEVLVNIDGILHSVVISSVTIAHDRHLIVEAILA